MVVVSVNPALLRWARERASLETADLARKIGLGEERIVEWERTGKLALQHLERVADKTHTPIGCLFLPAPPDERLPIADFRRVAGQPAARPSPDLLDTIYTCQQRQNWYREHLVAAGETPLPFVGSARLTEPPATVAKRIRKKTGFDDDPRLGASHDDAFRALAKKIENAGVLVMRSGVVGNNTHRKLRASEFLGFALSDEYAPLVFVNVADWPARKTFTLAHELGHVWLGRSGVSDVDMESDQKEERFCNAVAAEVLAPLDRFRDAWSTQSDPRAGVREMARRFNVSSLVALLRARDARLISNSTFEALWSAERAEFDAAPPKSTGKGGDFYLTKRSRLGGRFARAVVVSALEGRTTYTQAFRLLGVTDATFNDLARTVGVAI
ncbi:MAG: ImmA/IrrE family metallo-endopeptidase [Planctomycetes bacterium]|nr:ImmA/IrrE family metallo-endopeptidase [Planctomycetota bacterium]